MLRHTCWFLLIFVLTGLCGAQELSSGEQFEGSLAAPTYESGYVLDWDSPAYSKFTLYAPDARLLYSLPDRRPGTFFFEAWAVDADGTAVRAYRDRAQQGYLDVLDTAGHVTRVIETGAYVPTHVTFAPDHSIWTVGFASDYAQRGEDFHVVRHYSRTGQKLAESVAWSEIAGDENAYTALPAVIGGRRLFTARDRIGFFSHASEGHPKWIEVSFAGKLLGQYDLTVPDGQFFTPVAMTESGNVYARISTQEHFVSYGYLDKSNGDRRRVSGYPHERLIGTDGDDLVFAQQVTAGTVVKKVASSAVTVREALNTPDQNP